MKKYRSYNFEGLTSPLLPHIQRGQLLRESLYKDGKEPEWMCIICGFDNHPRHKHCRLCGTEQQFTKEYKEAKKLRRTEYKLRREKEHEKILKQISIPDDAQINSQSLIPFTFRKNESNSSNSSAGGSGSFNSFGKLKLGLSPEKRREALNYRRLNQLSLRQKSARRRKTWQRVMDENSGDLVWVRVAASEVYINNARLGYTPRTSMNSEGSNSSVLSNSGGGSSNGNSSSSSISTNLNNNPSSSTSESHGGVLTLTAAAATSSSQYFSSSRRLKEKKDSFGDVLSTSPGFTSGH